MESKKAQGMKTENEDGGSQGLEAGLWVGGAL